MEDRQKIIADAEEWVKQGTEIADNFTNFVEVMAKELPKEQQEEMNKALKSINIGDLSPTIEKVNKEIQELRKKYGS